uniref:DUF2194 domain-containing protein n=1 Tax=Roseovarius indicus TaxID=540747 RepID=UPI003B520EAF
MPQLRILLVTQENDAAGANAAIALEQARLAFDHHVVETGALPKLDGYAAVLLAIEYLPSTELERMAAFVRAGGGLVSAFRIPAEGWWDLFGIAPPRGGAEDIYSEHHSEGLVFRGSLFPSFAGIDLSTGYALSHSALDIHPLPEAEIVARTGVGRPLAWRVRRGEGRVLYWNSDMLSRKQWRGLIVESTTAVMAVSAVPRANVAVFQADDFPAPLGVPSERRWWRREAGPLPRDFYAAHWFPDVLALSRRSGFPMTCFAVFCYTWKGEDIVPPVTDNTRKDCFAAFRAERGEVGLHGLNHQPLLSSVWGDRKRMADGLHKAMGLWQEQELGPPPTSYVPANNEYDSDGVAALVEAVPSINAICGSYLLPDVGTGGAREYGPEPYNKEVFALPRATWGYGGAIGVLATAVSQVAATGVWSHFLHPDDLEDKPLPGELGIGRRNRSGQSWRGMLHDLSRFLSEMRRRHPWLRGCTTSEGAARLKAHLSSEWRTDIGEKSVTVTGPVGGTIELRINGEPVSGFGAIRGAKTLHEDEGPGFRRRVIELEEMVAEIELRQMERVS